MNFLLILAIRKLQVVLTKVALLLGVQIHVPVCFEGIIAPEENGSKYIVTIISRMTLE